MARFQGARSRNTCIRCRQTFSWVVHYSRHLGECKEDIDVEFVLELLGVSENGDRCWEMSLERGDTMPKFGISPGEVEKVHVIVCTGVNGPAPDGKMCCHWCDNRKCLNPGHLYWGTASENSKDAYRNKRRKTSQDQLDKMQQGRVNSPKNKARMTKHNRALAEKNKGSNHWTNRSPEEKERWINAMTNGRREAKRL